MTEMMWLTDCYTKEWNAEILEVNDKEIVLDKTYFYPQGGGQPNDSGKIIQNGEYNVVASRKEGDKIIHTLDNNGLSLGSVHCVLDWEKRYKLMRYHTASHVLSRIIFNIDKALVSGKQIHPDRARIDFTIEDFNREKLPIYEAAANKIIAAGRNVSLRILPKEDAMKIEDIIRLKAGIRDDIKDVCVVDINDFDVQACAGTHVKDIKEIGKIKITKAESKGKHNKRIEFVVE